MKYVISVKERVNPGNYEFLEISGQVEFDAEDVPGRQDPGAFGQQQLDGLLARHRQRCLELLPEESDSFLTVHPALEGDS